MYLILSLSGNYFLVPQGQNWMIGGNFQTSNRGIETDDMETNFVNNSWCVADINLTQVPFRYVLIQYLKIDKS